MRLFAHLNLTRSGKTYFTFHESRFSRGWADATPAGYVVKPISKETVASITDNQQLVDYITFAWTTTEAYYKKGFGFCAVADDQCAALCISVFGSSAGEEAGIKTFPGHGRKGLAFALASAFVQECLERESVPLWSCFSDNAASINLAGRLGFEVEASHPIYFARIGSEYAQ